MRAHLDVCCPLAVVEDGQLTECLAHAEPADQSQVSIHDHLTNHSSVLPSQHLAVLDHLVLALGRHVEVGPKLACRSSKVSAKIRSSFHNILKEHL